MHALDLKIPPPLVALAVGLAMWAASYVGLQFELPQPARWAGALVIALIGGGVSLAGVTAFRRAKTTVNPLKPQNASSLVTGGIYRFTRNPMYVGLALVLIGWAIVLQAALPLLGLPTFVLYISAFQIQPEERALTAIFGGEFTKYTQHVRRWL